MCQTPLGFGEKATAKSMPEPASLVKVSQLQYCFSASWLAPLKGIIEQFDNRVGISKHSETLPPVPRSELGMFVVIVAGCFAFAKKSGGQLAFC